MLLWEYNDRCLPRALGSTLCGGMGHSMGRGGPQSEGWCKAAAPVSSLSLSRRGSGRGGTQFMQHEFHMERAHGS